MRHQRSVGLDSLASSGPPPPGYTSQQDTTSVVAMDSDEEEEVPLNHLSPPPPPPLMDSPYRDPLYTAPLPSPYSIEDLRLVVAAPQPPAADQNQNSTTPLHRSPTQSCARVHSYSHPPVFNSRSQSSPNVHHTGSSAPVRSSSYYLPLQQRDAPHVCDDLTCYSPSHIISTDDLSTPNGRRASTSEEHWQPPPVQAENRLQHHQTRAPYTNYTPSPPARHRRQHSSNPPPLRTMSYPGPYDAYAGYRDESAFNNMMMTNSTVTILSPPEEPPAQQQQRRRRQSLQIQTPNPVPTRGIKNFDHSLPPPPPPTPPPPQHTPPTLTQTQPTNHVHLSRKCNPSIPISKSWGWRRKSATMQPPPPIAQIMPPARLLSSSSAITGAFIINPELHIPSSLLNAMEGSVFRFKPSSLDNNTRRKTNLRLEIENGGIDVDIRLVPTTTTNDTPPVPAQVGPSASTTAFSRPSPTSTTSQSSSSALRRAATLRDKKKPSQPTTIDLRIKETVVQNQEIVPFPLIARIHAPNPRPPFHLFASTVDIVAQPLPVPYNTREKENQPRASTSNPPTPSTTTPFTQRNPASSEPSLITNPSPPSPSNRTRRSLSKPRPQRRTASSTHHDNIPPVPPMPPSPSSLPTATQLDLTCSSHCSSLSPVYLHLPRTFRGPLTIQISSGHVGHRLRLSEGLEREVALIRESEFGRGYFVGGLDVDADRGRVRPRREEEEEEEEEEEMGVDHDANLNEKAGSKTSNIVEKTPRMTQQQQQPSPNEDSELSSSSLSPSPSSLSSSASTTSTSSPSSSATTLQGGRRHHHHHQQRQHQQKGLEEWHGDRIEILVGAGDVYLQFEDEEEGDDPFGSTRCLRKKKKQVGFWKRFTKKVFFM